MADVNGDCAATATQRRPLLSQTETIKKLQNENLELRIKVRSLTESINRDNENVDRDLVADLMRQNSELRNQIEERDKREEQKKEEKETENRGCQTNLDSNNVDDLVRAYVELKKLQSQEYDRQPHPTVTITRQTSATNKQLNLDEKKILDQLYRIDGCMTTALDRLKAVYEK